MRKIKFNKETNSIIKGDKEVGCIVCHEPTLYIEVCSETNICSDECVKKFYDQYYSHLENDAKNI